MCVCGWKGFEVVIVLVEHLIVPLIYIYIYIIIYYIYKQQQKLLTAAATTSCPAPEDSGGNWVRVRSGPSGRTYYLPSSSRPLGIPPSAEKHPCSRPLYKGCNRPALRAFDILYGR